MLENKGTKPLALGHRLYDEAAFLCFPLYKLSNCSANEALCLPISL